VRLVKAQEVQALTGLSADRLREWAGRRGLVRPDVPARGKGSQARYSWQTVLALRLAAVLRDQFKVELQAHRELLGKMQSELTGRSFPALRGCVMALYGNASVHAQSERTVVEGGDPGGSQCVPPAGSRGSRRTHQRRV
jgi:hypothetical protein